MRLTLSTTEPVFSQTRRFSEMAMGLKPLGDRVVVKPLSREEVTKSGIVLPDTAKEKPQEGTVVAVGPGRVLDNGQRVTVELKDGDRVPVSYTHLRAHETRHDLVCR